jgi:hypothetical protein
MNTSITTVTELPEALHGALQKYVDRHPGISWDEAIAQSIALFLGTKALTGG